MAALELLHALGALDLDARLTSPLGTFMAELPLEAPLAKALLVSGELQCSEEMLTVAAMFSVQSPWISQRGEHLALDDAKLRFATVRVALHWPVPLSCPRAPPHTCPPQRPVGVESTSTTVGFYGVGVCAARC